MYILIDKRRMAVVYRCEKVETVRALANIELTHTTCNILEETCAAGYPMNVGHLQDLFKNLTGGTDPYSANADYLIGQIIRLCQSATPSSVDAFEATVQSLHIRGTDLGYYRYIKGASVAELMAYPYHPPALVGNWELAQGLPPPTVQTAPPAPAIQQPWAVAPSTAPPKYAPPWA